MSTASLSSPTVDKTLTFRQRLRRWLRPRRRLKFTRVGRYFTGMTLLVGFGAINTGNNLLYLLLGMMLSLIVVSGILSERVINRVSVTHKLPGRLFARHPAPIEMVLSNSRRRTPSFSIEVLERIDGVDKKRWPGAYFLRVDANGRATSSFRFAFPRRGRIALEGFEIVTHFPFGLFRKSRDIDQPSEVIVFPALAEPGVVPALSELPAGDVRKPRPGRGGEFYGLRDYRHADDIRDIHWKATARRDTLITREREKEEARTVTLALLAAWPSRLESRLATTRKPKEVLELVDAEIEHAIEVCAGLAERLLSQGYVVALATGAAYVAGGTGAAQLDRILHTLALVTVEREANRETSGRFSVEPTESCILIGVAGELEGVQAGKTIAHVPTRKTEEDAT